MGGSIRTQQRTFVCAEKKGKAPTLTRKPSSKDGFVNFVCKYNFIHKFNHFLTSNYFLLNSSNEKGLKKKAFLSGNVSSRRRHLVRQCVLGTFSECLATHPISAGSISMTTGTLASRTASLRLCQQIGTLRLVGFHPMSAMPANCKCSNKYGPLLLTQSHFLSVHLNSSSNPSQIMARKL